MQSHASASSTTSQKAPHSPAVQHLAMVPCINERAGWEGRHMCENPQTWLAAPWQQDALPPEPPCCSKTGKIIPHATSQTSGKPHLTCRETNGKAPVSPWVFLFVCSVLLVWVFFTLEAGGGFITWCQKKQNQGHYWPLFWQPQGCLTYLFFYPCVSTM